MYNSISTFVSLCSYNHNRCYFRRIFSDRGPGFGPVQSEITELRTGPNWTNTSGSSDRTELDYAARASNWTELDQPPRLARTMVRSGPSRALVLVIRVVVERAPVWCSPQPAYADSEPTLKTALSFPSTSQLGGPAMRNQARCPRLPVDNLRVRSPK